MISSILLIQVAIESAKVWLREKCMYNQDRVEMLGKQALIWLEVEHYNSMWLQLQTCLGKTWITYSSPSWCLATQPHIEYKCELTSMEMMISIADKHEQLKVYYSMHKYLHSTFITYLI